MNENLIDKLSSDYIIQFDASAKHETNPTFQDNDSDSSIFNLLDGELSDKTHRDTPSPSFSQTEAVSHDNMSQNIKVAMPDVKSESNDKIFEEHILSMLPRIITVEKASIQYEVFDPNHPCLSQSFKKCFNCPVLDLLVVVLNPEKLVSLYQGYFAGIPRLASELINLDSKYWKSLISNNDENLWENHYKSVTDKFNSRELNELEFEMGPVIRCRLRASHKQQYNQQFNFFFVQPCSYMVKMNHVPNRSFQAFSKGDLSNESVFMVSYYNIMRECDTEFALKGSAAASLQKVITNSICPNQLKLDSLPENFVNKGSNNRVRRTLNNNNQLSVNISPPAYINSEKAMLNAPLTYPLLNEHQFPKSRTQIQQHLTQHRSQIPINNNQYMNRGVSINIINPDQHHYQPQYQGLQSTSTLQYILENRNTNYPSSKQIHNGPLHMVPQHSQPYQNTGRPNAPCYLPLDHIQSASSNCSLSSPTSFLPSRHLGPMSSNNILITPDQYFRNGNQINLIDSVQVSPSMMTVVRSMPSSLNHGNSSYYCSTAQNQQLSQSHIHVVNSIPHQNQFSATSLPSYCNDKNEIIHMSGQPYNENRMVNKMSIKQESYDMSLSQKDWHTNRIMDDSIATTYNEPLNSMTNDSISFDIVEEILKAEEEKSENKQQLLSQSNSDNSDPLSFDLDDFVLIDHGGRRQVCTKGLTQTSNTSTYLTSEKQNAEKNYSKQSSSSSDSLLTLKTETLEKFTNSQKIGIKNLVNQQKDGKITKKQMLQQINEFVSHTLGKDNYQRCILEYWKTQHPNVDSTLSNINCSHIVQSPEEGPGISPTEQAAQSTTDIEDDKEHNCRSSKNSKDDNACEVGQRYNKCKSTTKSLDSSIYSITSTTSTGVLETLLNEHDNPVQTERNYSNFNTRLSISSIPKNQLSLDQLLMDDECSMLSGFNPSHDDKISRKASELPLRQVSLSNKSQPSTPNVSGNMGVLESLLNQKNPSMYRIRQKSTESILKHSKPSRQNSVDPLHEDNVREFGDKDNGIKKNSLLITLLNNSSGSLVDKYNSMTSSNPSSVDVTHSISQPKRQRMYSEANEDPSATKKQMDKYGGSGMDVFDFVDCELICNNTEFQSGKVTSSQPLSLQRNPTNKRNRKRCHSKDISNDSDESSDKLSTCDKTSSKAVSGDKKVILTALLDNRKMEDTTLSTVPSDLFSAINNDISNLENPTYKNVLAFEDNLDFEDIKIDDLDLEHLIDMSEQLEYSNINLVSSASFSTSQDPNIYSDNFSMNSFDPNYPALYTMVPPVINISQSEPIVPISKQSIIRVTDKNSILISAIQSSSTSNTISVECLDNERERLLKQQQQQKVYMGGKYLPLNQLGSSDVDSNPSKISHPLSLDLLSKQMKEVGPNVMVEPSNNVDNIRSRKSSFSRVLPAISPHSSTSNILPPSPVGRSSSSCTSVSTDIQGETVKLSTTNSSHVNHQQVREGLRLLVSNRSAQNNSKNNQRSSSSNLNELTNSSDFNVTRTSVSKSMIHYHSAIQVPSQPISYNLRPPINVSDCKATNFLEDSLVNDVFELEEMVNSKTINTNVENVNYQNTSFSKSSDESSGFSGDVMTMSTDMDSSQIRSTLQNSNKPPAHHHHHLPHYHHHHPHHHHHPTPLSTQPNNEPLASPSKDNKQNVNSTAGLLETLLSR